MDERTDRARKFLESSLDLAEGGCDLWNALNPASICSRWSFSLSGQWNAEEEDGEMCGAVEKGGEV
jgi:hypothetical protein